MLNLQLEGSYKGDIKLHVLSPQKVNNKVLLNVHGLYGLSGDPGSKSEQLGKVLTEKGIAHIVQCNSSRDWDIFEDGDFEKMKSAFEKKTFDDELKDLINTINYLLEHSEELFNQMKVEVYAVGNSLGGTLLSAICSLYPQIKKMVFANSGTGQGSSSKKLPVMNSVPLPTVIQESAAQFVGDVMLLQGSDDTTVPLHAGEELLSYYKNARSKKHKIIKGADHRFKGFYEKYTEEIVNLIV